MTRVEDLLRLYNILDLLEKKVSGKRRLDDCTSKMRWPERGVYFFFEPGELRSHSGEGLRLVRIGTHALTSGSHSTLWGRLRQHQGILKSGGGNHRGSIFRLYVGTALTNRGDWKHGKISTWGIGSSSPQSVRHSEEALEQLVSQTIRQMPFLWLSVDDEPSPSSQRGIIERNTIALVSNYNSHSHPLDPPSSNWLGHWSDRETVRCSGLWNSNHVAENYNPRYLDLLEKVVDHMRC